MRGWVIAAGVLLGALGTGALPQAASAQPTEGAEPADDQARTHFESGRLYYSRGQFEQAAEAFEAAYELSGRPELLYNIFLAHRDAGHDEQAIEALRGYLEQVEDPPRREQLEARLAAMERKLAEGDASDGDAGDGDAGDAGDGDGDTDGDGDGETGGGVAGAAGEGPGAGPWVLLGAGAAVAVAGVATGALALKKQSDLESQCGADRVCRDDPALRDDRDRGEALAIATDVLLPVGLVAASAGVVWLLLSGGDDAEQERPAASAACTPHGCSGAVRWQF